MAWRINCRVRTAHLLWIGFRDDALEMVVDEIKGHNYVLTPGRYVGTAVNDEDNTPFIERYAPLRAKLDSTIAANLKEVGYDG